MKLGFIGCGNMASAIISGTVKSGTVAGSDIYAFNPTETKVNMLAEKFGINSCKSGAEVADICDYIVLSVKPNVLAGVLNEIAGNVVGNGKVLISIAAGKSIDFIAENLNSDEKIVRIMPNINAVVSESCSAYCANSLVSENEKAEVEKLFSAVGTITEIDESMFPLFGVIGGCSPAFVYMFIDALARAGVQHGMKKELALKFAAQSVLGSAKTVLESNEHPFELIDKVCSPGGTTIEGVVSLQADGFESAVHNAVNKAVEKDKML
jgi:pyrroline-5-carboxylate reductase